MGSSRLRVTESLNSHIVTDLSHFNVQRLCQDSSQQSGGPDQQVRKTKQLSKHLGKRKQLTGDI